MSNTQQGDVLLYQSADGGEIQVLDGVVTMTRGPETDAYLRMFSGEWWGDDETSETEKIIDGLPATSLNLRRLEDAVKRDLKGLGETVTVTATIPSLDRVRIDIIVDGVEIVFIEDWPL